MQEIIAPVDRHLLERELTTDTLVRETNKGHNHIHIINDQCAPNTLREIGRLREHTFRHAGGGTGLDCDLDAFDYSSYAQLIVWNPGDAAIVGGYRFVLGNTVALDDDGTPDLATGALLKFSTPFIRDYLPQTIELGRSFIQPAYQPSSQNRKGLFSLDNLWDGLGALVVDQPHIAYFFGKVTMYPQFNARARDAILYFMKRYFPDREQLIVAREPAPYRTDIVTIEQLFTPFDDYNSALPTLNQFVRAQGENLPPLINAYMSLSPTMKTFGTARNHEFGHAEETGIIVSIADIYDAKKKRHVDTYRPVQPAHPIDLASA
jgi:hypothetical protein